MKSTLYMGESIGTLRSGPSYGSARLPFGDKSLESWDGHDDMGIAGRETVCSLKTLKNLN